MLVMWIDSHGQTSGRVVYVVADEHHGRSSGEDDIELNHLLMDEGGVDVNACVAD